MSSAQLHHVARETKDVDRLVRFYEKVLGFERTETPSFPPLQVVWLALPPPSSLSLHVILNPHTVDPLTSSPRDPSSLPSTHHLAFSVPNYDACIDTLKEMQIPIFEKTQQDGRIKQAFFFDPDGNGIEIGNWPAQFC